MYQQKQISTFEVHPIFWCVDQLHVRQLTHDGAMKNRLYIPAWKSAKSKILAANNTTHHSLPIYFWQWSIVFLYKLKFSRKALKLELLPASFYILSITTSIRIILCVNIYKLCNLSKCKISKVIWVMMSIAKWENKMIIQKWWNSHFEL